MRIGELHVDGPMQVAEQRRVVELPHLPGRPAHGDVRRGFELARAFVADRFPESGEFGLPPSGRYKTGRHRSIHSSSLFVRFVMRREAVRPSILVDFPEKIPQSRDVVVGGAVVYILRLLNGIRTNQSVNSIGPGHQHRDHAVRH
ncbi:hypothetical protein Y026_6265 [Burkholderia pseudomallei TSV28]|nr:hypothetical protein Y026_6265 [Burkholderia pseudomallei TSV28]